MRFRDCIFVKLTGREFQSWIADGTNDLSKIFKCKNAFLVFSPIFYGKPSYFAV